MASVAGRHPGILNLAPCLERYPTKLNQFDGGKSVFRAGLPSPKRLRAGRRGVKRDA